MPLASLFTTEPANEVAESERSKEIDREARATITDAFNLGFGPPLTGAADLAESVASQYSYMVGVSQKQAREYVRAAMELERLKHADFDSYQTGMRLLCFSLIADLREHATAPLTAEQYLEVLYQAAKHADFLGFKDGPAQ